MSPRVPGTIYPQHPLPAARADFLYSIRPCGGERPDFPFAGLNRRKKGDRHRNAPAAERQLEREGGYRRRDEDTPYHVGKAPPGLPAAHSPRTLSALATLFSILNSSSLMLRAVPPTSSTALSWKNALSPSILR